jgi:HK97 family phage major capsid protein
LNINQIIASLDREVSGHVEAERKARAEVDAILDLVQRERRDNLTRAEDDRCEALMSAMDAAKSARKIAEGKLERAKAVKAEEDQAELRLTETHRIIPANRGLANYDEVVRIGSDSRAYSPDTAAEWLRSADGKPAIVARGQRFADHDAVRAEIARNEPRDRIIAESHGDFGQYLRAMTTTSGSAIVPTIWAADVIDKARNAAVVLQAGALTVPMDSKILQIGRLTADPAPAFKTEGSPVTPGDLTYDYIQLTATSLTALVVTSLEFLQDAPNSSDLIQGALGKAMALEIDKAALFGQLGATGTNDEGAAYALASPYPKGILKNLLDNYSAGVLGFATNGTAQTAATPWLEILAGIYNPLRQNEQCTAMISNVALKQQYDGMVNTLNDPIRKPDTVAGMPWLVTNAIPSYTRGTMTSRATDVFAGDFSQVLIGQRLGLEIRVLTERYAENGQVGLLAYWRGDVQVARPKALCCYRALQGAL